MSDKAATENGKGKEGGDQIASKGDGDAGKVAAKVHDEIGKDTDKKEADKKEEPKKDDSATADSSKKEDQAKPEAGEDAGKDGERGKESAKEPGEEKKAGDLDGDGDVDYMDSALKLRNDLTQEAQDTMRSLWKNLKHAAGYGDKVPKAFPQDLGIADRSKGAQPEDKLQESGKPEGKRNADGQRLDQDGKVTDKGGSTADGADPTAKAGDPSKAEIRATDAGDGAKTDSSEPPSVWDNFVDWTSDTISAISKPVIEAASWAKEQYYDPLATWVGDEWNSWMDGAGEQKYTSKIDQVNKKAESQVNLDGAVDGSAGGIELPADAVEDGKTSFLGNELTVLRSGDTTFLRNDKGEVVAQQNPDGSYKMLLADKSTVDVKLGEKDANGNYKLERLERHDAEGKLTTKVVDGIVYTVNERNGRTWVSAAGDIQVDHNLTPQEQHEYLERIRKEFPDGMNGSAAIRFINGSEETVVGLKQLPGGGHVEIDFKNNVARLYEGGNSFQISGDKVQMIGPDGQVRDMTPGEAQQHSARVKEMLQRAMRHGRGNGVDGWWHDRDSSGRLVFRQDDPRTGDPITTTEVPPPAPPGQPRAEIRVTDHDSGEVTSINGNNFEVKDANNKSIMGFNEKEGLRTGGDNPFLLNDEGLRDLNTNTLLDENGDVYDGYGNLVSEGSIGKHTSMYDRQKAIDYAQDMAEQAKASQYINTMVSSMMPLILSNPHVARAYLTGAINSGLAALSSIENPLANAALSRDVGSAISRYGQAYKAETINSNIKELGVDSFSANEVKKIALGGNMDLAEAKYQVKVRQNGGVDPDRPSEGKQTV